jgi:hypothetical protein
MEDKTIVCQACGKEFVFTVSEQEFYKEKGFDNEPTRCADCRRARKQQRNQGGFKRDGNGGGGFGGKKRY